MVVAPGTMLLLAWARQQQQVAVLGVSLLSQMRSTHASLGSTRQFSSEEQAEPRKQTAIFAACVLERLPIVRSPPPEWEARYKAWNQMRQTREGLIKQYPTLEGKQKAKDSAALNAQDSGLWSAETKADREKVASTMKRLLADKLVLIIKARSSPAATAAAADAKQPSEQQEQQQPEWTFPFASHQENETIRQTAERGLKEAIGPAAVYFVGNAPMAHIDLGSSSSSADAPAASNAAGATGSEDQAGSSTSSSSRGGSKPDARVFFHLAQVVNDPWDVALADGAAVEHAWVSKGELQQYIKDQRLLSLARKML